MKFIIALCFVGLAVAAPPQKVQQVDHVDYVPIVRQESNVEHDGQFHYSYESADGSKAEQTGEVKVFDKDHAGVVSHGSFAYQGDDGKTYSLTYVADENGYHPEGEHLPVAPEVPAAIVRALEYIAAHPYKEEPNH